MCALLALPTLPRQINTGPWIGGYSLPALHARTASSRWVLPICSLGTPSATLAALGDSLLPPLYHEALAGDPSLRGDLVAQIARCFPFPEGTPRRALALGKLEIVELPPQPPPPPHQRPRIVAFGVDTTIEQHGPHLPLATDTIQTYGVLEQVARERSDVFLAPALEHGHLTWGLGFGFSIDLTPALLDRYFTGFVRALVAWLEPDAVYVADVHGSLVHRETIAAALARSVDRPSRFRWLHEPLVEFAAARGDMHAGGVETALVHHLAPDLVDAAWWPPRRAAIAAHEMRVADAVALSRDLPAFAAHVEATGANGVIGAIANDHFDPAELLARMLAVAREDLHALAG